MTQSDNLVGDSTTEQQRTKLTQRLIAQLTYSKANNKKDIWWDTELRGFGVRIYPSGKKAFIVSYRVDRRKRLKTIGDTSLITLVQARDRARQDTRKCIGKY